MEEDIKMFFDKKIKEGYIDESGEPKKCVCGSTKFKQVNQYYGNLGIEEYSLMCIDKDCLKIVGAWAFGHWII